MKALVLALALPDTANDHGMKDASGKGEFELELDNSHLSPTVVNGTPGQQLKLE